MARVVVLTDSTASLPPELLGAAALPVVPLRVEVDGQDHDDGTGPARHRLVDRLGAGATAATSQPIPSELAAAMRGAIEDGAAAVVALHLSAELSGTVALSRVVARRVSEESGVPVHVVDSRTTAGGLGLAALAAGEAAARGADVDRVLAVAREVAARSRVLFVVPELGHLARGGRMSPTRASLGSALGVRPLLTIEGGRIVVSELVRGAARAQRRVLELAVRTAGGPGAAPPRGEGGPVRVVVHHFAAPERAAELAGALRERLTETGAQLDSLTTSEVTAVIGAHTGPGVLGVALAPLSEEHRR